jgi:hypothetical protein
MLLCRSTQPGFTSGWDTYTLNLQRGHQNEVIAVQARFTSSHRPITIMHMHINERTSTETPKCTRTHIYTDREGERKRGRKRGREIERENAGKTGK